MEEMDAAGNPGGTPEVDPREKYAALLANERARKDRIEELLKLQREEEQLIRDLAEEKRLLQAAIREKDRQDAERRRREEEAAAKRAHAERLSKQVEVFEAATAVKAWRARAMQHQLVGAQYLAAAERAICADSMGVGKTLQSGIWLDYLDAKKTLIICPGDVMQNFADEFSKWTDRPILVIGKRSFNDQSQMLDIAMLLPRVVVIINYEAWNRSMRVVDKLISVRFDSVIVDEAHTIKETSGRPYAGVERIVHAENSCPRDHGALVLNAVRRQMECQNPDCGWDSTYREGKMKDRRSVKYILTMTGTPILNRPTEIYPLLHLINDELFKYKNDFIRDYCQYSYAGKLEWKYGGQGRLANELSAFYLRRTHETAGIVLPPQTPVVHEIDFDEEAYPKQAEIMRTLRKHSQMQIDEGRVVTITDLLALLTRERQAAVWPGGIKLPVQRKDEFGNLMWDWENPYKNGEPRPITDLIHVGDRYRESIKLDKAVELIDELVEDGQRVVVFSQFKEALKEMQNRLGPRSVRFDGDTDDTLRDEIKRNFDRSQGETAKWDTVLCHYKTGGVGLNLTAATALIVLDEEWNPGKNEQAYARINRIGQTEPTTVHILRVVSEISHIDEWLSKLIMAKADLIAGFTTEMQEKSDVAMQMQTELQQILNGDWGVNK